MSDSPITFLNPPVLTDETVQNVHELYLEAFQQAQRATRDYNEEAESFWNGQREAYENVLRMIHQMPTIAEEAEEWRALTIQTNEARKADGLVPLKPGESPY